MPETTRPPERNPPTEAPAAPRLVNRRRKRSKEPQDEAGGTAPLDAPARRGEEASEAVRGEAAGAVTDSSAPPAPPQRRRSRVKGKGKGQRC